MARPTSQDPTALHRSWIGLLQPDGIVVSTAALVDAGLSPDPLAQGELDQLRALCGLGPEKPRDRDPVEAPRWLVGQALARCFVEVLGCDAEWIHGTSAQPFPADAHGLVRPLAEFSEDLSPTFALENPNAGTAHADRRWLCLMKQGPDQWDLDRPNGQDTTASWIASPMAKFERLLRETAVPIGVIANDTELRLVYAPPGEGTGVMTFPLALLLGPESDAVLGALVMLLGRARWLDTSPDGATAANRDKQFLPHLLEQSRKYQNTVSTALSEQVLDALWELLRGLQSAHVATQGALLRDWINGHPDEIYGGLLAVLLRLVFLLYAEDRDQLPAVGFYPANYGVRSLYEKLRDDAGRHPDTMNLRLGAWARLLATFRLVHDGGGHGSVHLPAREGSLFSPDTYAFLEGRPLDSHAQRGEALDVPAIPDGVVFQVLEKLLRVDREDLSYKTLGVEELGSVYESMMGFTVLTTSAPSLALLPDHVVVDLKALLSHPGADREKVLAKAADASVSEKYQEALRSAVTIEQLADALTKVRSPRTPAVVPAGSLVLQPTAERRRSGSHYTPRTLTAPLVEKTLRPVFATLGETPTHEQILALKVCDPAMGSGAFLVAACRWLGDRLHEAWQRDGGRGKPLEVARITPDDDERVVARRLVAQHCIYGVDKNPLAVNLARLSLWLETLAKEHPFTFLDHVLREGDSLIGVTREQVQYLRLEPITKGSQLATLPSGVFDGVKRAEASRAGIRALALSDDTAEKRRLLDESEHETRFLRDVGDAQIATFFATGKPKVRSEALVALRESLLVDGKGTDNLRPIVAAAKSELKQRPFHWELEFPEVFSGSNAGFDAILGNPPFMRGGEISGVFGDAYLHWLLENNPGSHGNSDLSAYFLRRAFSLLGASGAAGLIATNTIAQGDTRNTGLQWILARGAVIYDATPSMSWPGTAGVTVALFHFAKGAALNTIPSPKLSGQDCSAINSSLGDDVERPAAKKLASNAGVYSQGVHIYGQGFVLTPEERGRLELEDPASADVVRPYLGGEEVNRSPTQAPERFVIAFGSMSLEEASRFPGALEIARTRVKPERDQMRDTPINRRLKQYWWRFWADRPEFMTSYRKLDRGLVAANVSKHLMFSFQPTERVPSKQLYAFLLDGYCHFSVLQSRIHGAWAWLLSSTMRDAGIRYTASECFETFPFPQSEPRTVIPELEELGRQLYTARAGYMAYVTQGLTQTYNQILDPQCTETIVVELRQMHEDLDRAVLAAYGWDDLEVPPYEIATTEDAKMALRRFETEVVNRLFALNAERAEVERLELEAKALAIAAEKAALKAAIVQGKAKQAPKPGKNKAAGATAELKGIK